MNRVRSGTKQHLVGAFMCRKGAWTELTAIVTDWECLTKQAAWIKIYFC